MGVSDSDGGKEQAPSPTTKPYLVRAIYEWALDNGFTPQLLISTDQPDVVVPRQYVKDNQIVLNIHPQAVSGLELGNEWLWCSARFSGNPLEITAPISSVLAVYARENGQGIVFNDDENSGIPPTSNPPGSTKDKPNKKPKSKLTDVKQAASSHLKIVK